MAGIEVASLALGAVPIIIEILKSYHIVRDRFNTFRKYTSVVNELRLSYVSAAAIFKNDCQLLLLAVVEDARDVSPMLKDPTHEAWMYPQLEERFRAFLEEDYSLFEDLIIQIRDVLRDTIANLWSSLPELPGKNPQHAAAQNQIKQRFVQAFKISYSENQLCRCIEKLDSRNSKFGKLNEQRRQLQQQPLAHPGSIVRRSLPRKYHDIQIASQRLHESLHRSWSCKNDLHTEHETKLCLEATAEYGDVRLDMVMACTTTLSAQSGAEPTPEPRLWLYVQTLTMHTPSARPVAAMAGISNALLTTIASSIPASSVPPQESLASKAKRKLKSVRFDTPAGGTKRSGKVRGDRGSQSPTRTSDLIPQSYVTMNLDIADSICCHLNTNCASANNVGDDCLGYLDCQSAPQTSRLTFYDARKTAATRKSQFGAGGAAMTVTQVLQDLRILHQLTLAHRIAFATLQYHSTSWLASNWGLEDISYFKQSDHVPINPNSQSSQRPSDILVRELHSLHLSTRFGGAKSGAVDNEDIVQRDLDLTTEHGIRNLPLARLGVALLEIGSQATLSSFVATSTKLTDNTSVQFLHRDIVHARKLLQNPPRAFEQLGRRYHKIVQQCLYCDFSCGDDLTSNILQSAVYTDIVCGLETLLVEVNHLLGTK
ncbi:hypothetical protein HBI75_204750 [Parastagonospora nodorum]|nr:hypothetical protein HBI75_204750 [Parastagonospora nodorum]